MMGYNLICGVANLKNQQRQLCEHDLTYYRTLTLLVAMETAEREARDLSGIKDVHTVHPRCLSLRLHHTEVTISMITVL